MKINEDTARSLALLSNITLSDDELSSLKVDLEKIVEYISELGNLNTSGVKPTYQVTGLSNVWRKDIIENQLPREELLKLSSDHTETAMKVPKVL